MTLRIFIITLFILFLSSACGSLNRAHGELHYNINISKGQELLDLKKALDENAKAKQKKAETINKRRPVNCTERKSGSRTIITCN